MWDRRQRWIECDWCVYQFAVLGDIVPENALPDSYPRLASWVEDGFADEFLHHPWDVAFAQEQEVQVGGDRRFFGPAEDDFGRALVFVAQPEANRGEYV